jgi:hypothetical protein
LSDKGSLAAAKQAVMGEYFDKWAQRMAFLDQLAASDHADEALLLACCYIDALANNLYPGDEGSHRKFVRVLSEHSNNSVFAAVYPPEILAFLASRDASWAKQFHDRLASHLKSLVGPLLGEDAFLGALQPPLNAQECEHLRRHLWRGTIASVLYTHVRSEAVHNFPPMNVVFGVSVFGGEPMRDLNYHLVGPAAKAVLTVCHDISLSTGKYYGHDFAHLFAAVQGSA